jgi:hypothetical protein
MDVDPNTLAADADAGGIDGATIRVGGMDDVEGTNVDEPPNKSAADAGAVE